MQNYSGIDEAGLGPILGPFCAAVTTFSAPEPLKELLKDVQKKLFYVDDSKKVYQGKNGLNRLELNVLTFFTMLNGEIPPDINSFIPTLKSKWNMEDNTTLPVTANRDEIYKKATEVGNLFKERGIELLSIKRSAVSPVDFNHLLDKWDNKSIACQKIINPLLLSVMNHGENHEIVIDKQGGRKFYKEYLDELFGMGNTQIIKEENNHSHYQIGTKHIHFMAKADSTNFAVALSSMFAKYMRELSMISFNKYWQKQIPEIKRTAGYYTDGIRFIEDLKNNSLLPHNRDIIIRKK